ncbi:MAG: SpoIIE family protein phosphatase [Crocinitomicaceae bacterium]|nr:SpoIIE family protein phosphatase [Crocinitomicaceae bacterium]
MSDRLPQSEQLIVGYRLNGLHDDWRRLEGSNTISYDNLSRREYEFEYRVSDLNTHLSSDKKKLAIRISKPWYLKFYMLITYTLLGVIIILFLVRWRTSQLRKRQKELEDEVEKATSDIIHQKEIIEEAHQEITDYINYAERIQRSFMATSELLDKHLDNYLVYFNPKEAVSGDFYWAGELANRNFAVSCADSTGHGVPGAIMSILNISGIEKAVENGATAAGDIFNQARVTIIDRLKKDGSAEGGKDGMDASLLILNPEKTKLEYVAANNPIWIVREGELIDIKGEKMPVGKHDNDHIPFEGGEFELQKGDIIYAMTDGFQDQFGGEKGKKFKVKPMKRMLLDVASLPMKE